MEYLREKEKADVDYKNYHNQSYYKILWQKKKEEEEKNDINKDDLRNNEENKDKEINGNKID